jgi:hypothetical protein
MNVIVGRLPGKSCLALSRRLSSILSGDAALIHDNRSSVALPAMVPGASRVNAFTLSRRV